MKENKVIIAKCKKVKKPLNDKQKDERKHKIKKVFKTILDIIVYIFAGFMLIGLIFGCSNNYKKASASFYSENYTSLSQIPIERNDDIKLYYYYSVDYKKTFPDYSSLISSGVSTSGGATVFITPSYNFDNDSFTTLRLAYSTNRFLLQLDNASNTRSINLASFYISDTVIARPDVISSIFGGNYTPYISSGASSNSQAFYKWLVYYLSNKGYSRVNYSMPLNPVTYNYLLTNSVNEDNLRNAGFIFRNDAIYDSGVTVRQTLRQTVFMGAFRCNGVVYTSIEFGLTTVYGNYEYAGNYQPYYYYNDGLYWSSQDSGFSSSFASSNNEAYKGWYYLDYIAYQNSDLRVVVWSTYQRNTGNGIKVQLQGVWTGDTESSVSPYRDLYIINAFDSVTNQSGNFEYFPQINYASYAQYFNLIGDGYVSLIPGGLQDDNSGYFNNVFGWISMALTGLLPLLGYSLVPGITIATIIMIPVSVTIILFVVKLFKR